MMKRVGLLGFCLVAMLFVGSDGFAPSPAYACPSPLPGCQSNNDCSLLCGGPGICGQPINCRRTCLCIAEL